MDSRMDRYCWECDAAAGEPCVYISAPTAEYSRSPQVLAQKARLGQPTQRAHNGRTMSEKWQLRLWLTRNADILIQPPT